MNQLSASAMLSRAASLRRAAAAAFSTAAARPETGLYGFDVLRTAKGFRRFVDDAIERSDELVAYIGQLPPSAEIVRAMDEISNTVCSVIDSAELCRNTHPDKEFMDEADKASMRIYEHLQYLNTNTTLYNAILKAESEGVMLTEEARRAATTLRVDFEKGGIHLPKDKLEHVNHLNLEIAQLGRKFSENVMNKPGFVDIYPASRIPRNMQRHFKSIHRIKPWGDEEQRNQMDTTKQKGLRIVTDSGTLSTALRWVSDEEIRKQVYLVGNSEPRENITVLGKLINARDELAKTMGCKSYGDFAIRPNMAASVDVVMSFLKDLSGVVRHKAGEEFKRIQDFKRNVCNEKSAKLEPWDEDYFIGMMKSAVHNLDVSVVAAYFPLSQCLKGLNVLVESLFGATFHQIPMGDGESWHPDVMKLSLHHPDEGNLGFMYLDLYSRKGKYPGCAHFAIRGGRRLQDSNYQLPIVALVCNFSSSSKIMARLNHWDVETLFHEFGHALHSLLSRTEYQHFSGTRVALDVAEMPSNLFEFYAWDYRVLRKFAVDETTGDPIPEKLVKALNASRNMFPATELQRQIFYSIMDLTLFGEQGSKPMDTISTVADLRRKHTSWKCVEGTHWHTRFTHLINYGAGYYSYLYARCFATTIWQEVCQGDPLSRSTGSALRDKFLKHGGAKDPSALLKDFVGDSIIINSGGGIIPDISSLCKEVGL
ncbi:mitochondrial intermediate peptidase, mitochondrial isoform X1 [Oryza sativa Japonica Group]|uniref:Mitochondrial intermediate peptidase n=2 Tax=Oryza sativa subsp. japonica TaxID=39947 RepID=Q655E3_ORYSJ|nr:mitochondrial intermediate peptidase, mitochondrial [Oryza sativa Japonica Group]BAD45574.1 putative mitochondrial intermediate peptidase [Oryza sativa Japonica Group]BAD46044.1 putative mitochondrial intermediate peptidase [Oryza sativa Japonica Group]BAF20315.1 Os06g0686500 [Oryza sativa Japonica Group]BAS99194.1 Os06g0686500 [Oryza sativa Japonica Group]|eukprot:NP_001058401.1 Os06g0686500 [Oryza sativa Japonica Group]